MVSDKNDTECAAFGFGVLGEYLWRNLDESRKRPPFIVASVIPAACSESENTSTMIKKVK